MKQLICVISILLNSIIYGQAGDKVIVTDVIKHTNSEKAREYYNKGVGYSNINDFSNAIKFYKLAIEKDSSFIDAYDNLGFSYRKLNQLDEALYYYNISYDKNKKNITSIMNMAVVFGLQEKYDLSLKFYKEVIKCEPENPEGYYGACQTLYNSNNSKDALEYCLKAEDKYLKSKSEYVGDCYYILSVVCYNNNDKVSAKKYLKLCKKYGVNVDISVEKMINK